MLVLQKGKTPLSYALEIGAAGVVDLFIKRGADAMMADDVRMNVF